MAKFQDSGLQQYADNVAKYVKMVSRKSAKAIAENAEHQIPKELAEELYGARYGEIFYDFAIDFPSTCILQAFETECQWADHNDLINCFLRILGSSKCHLFASREKVIICYSTRNVVANYCVDELSFSAFVGGSKDSNVIDWSNAFFYVRPISNFVYISDGWEESHSNQTDTPEEWLIVPFEEDMTWERLHLMALDKAVECVSAGMRPTYFNSAKAFFNSVEVGQSTSGWIDEDSLYVLEKSGMMGYERDETVSDFDLLCYILENKTKSLRITYKKEIKKQDRVIFINSSQQKHYRSQACFFPSSFVGIDFETLYAQRVSACSVGMVKYRDGEIVDRYYTLIKPPFDYPEKCGCALTWIHGFTESMLENERTFAEILPEMEAFVEGLPLVSHNACVERACIRDCVAYYGISTSLDYDNIIDTYPLSKRVERQLGIVIEGSGTHSLDIVCRRFNVKVMSHHNALDDAEMCGNLLLVFSEILNGADIQPNLEAKTSAGPKINPEDKVQRSDLDEINDNPFKNKVVVLTGFAKCDSQQYAHILNELGAIVKESVTKKTNILITGYNAGPSKIQKAKELGALIMSEEEFLKSSQQ